MPDLFEPLRPIVHRVIFELVQSETFSGSAFRINSDGICRLNAQLARRIVRLAEECVSHQAVVLARELLALVGLSLASKRGARLNSDSLESARVVIQARGCDL